MEKRDDRHGQERKQYYDMGFRLVAEIATEANSNASKIREAITELGF